MFHICIGPALENRVYAYLHWSRSLESRIFAYLHWSHFLGSRIYTRPIRGPGCVHMFSCFGASIIWNLCIFALVSLSGEQNLCICTLVLVWGPVSMHSCIGLALWRTESMHICIGLALWGAESIRGPYADRAVCMYFYLFWPIRFLSLRNAS